MTSIYNDSPVFMHVLTYIVIFDQSSSAFDFYKLLLAVITHCTLEIHQASQLTCFAQDVALLGPTAAPQPSDHIPTEHNQFLVFTVTASQDKR